MRRSLATDETASHTRHPQYARGRRHAPNMKEYRIAQDCLDARITTIYGGTTEMMKEIVGRDLGL